MNGVPAARPGLWCPLGATVRDGGTNFAVASASADGMLLCLFDERGEETRLPMLDRRVAPHASTVARPAVRRHGRL